MDDAFYSKLDIVNYIHPLNEGKIRANKMCYFQIGAWAFHRFLYPCSSAAYLLNLMTIIKIFPCSRRMGKTVGLKLSRSGLEIVRLRVLQLWFLIWFVLKMARHP